MGKKIGRRVVETEFEKSTNLGMYVHHKSELFLSVYVDDLMMVGKKSILGPLRTRLQKDIDLEDPTPFLNHVCVGCTQREQQLIMKQVNPEPIYFEESPPPLK